MGYEQQYPIAEDTDDFEARYPSSRPAFTSAFASAANLPPQACSCLLSILAGCPVPYGVCIKACQTDRMAKLHLCANLNMPEAPDMKLLSIDPFQRKAYKTFHRIFCSNQVELIHLVCIFPCRTAIINACKWIHCSRSESIH